MRDEFLWVEKYRPKTIDECILPDGLKETFRSFIAQNNIPNLILSGTAGVGKTTVARAMLDQIDADYIVINGSMSGNIDTLRTEILNFASTVSFSGGRKYIILDEADYLNANSTNPLSVILWKNFPRTVVSFSPATLKIESLNRYILGVLVEFKIEKKDMAKLAMQFMKRIVYVLNTERISFDKSVIAELITKHIPDWRRVINELQRYSVNGSIDTGIFVNISDDNIKILVNHLKEKNFTEMRKWVSENNDTDTTTLFRKLYDISNDVVKSNSIPELILILADYQYKAAFVADAEINLVAAFTRIMIDIEFE